MLMVVPLPHCPAEGVNVYVAVPDVEVVIVAGLHVPVMPFVEVVGSAGGVLFWHNGPSCVKVGATPEETTIFIVAVDPHWPAAGVNV